MQHSSYPEIIEEAPHEEHGRRSELALEIPSQTLRDVREDGFTRIDLPPTPSLTPKKVSFSPLPSPRPATTGEPSSPSPSNNWRAAAKSLLPKLSFKFRNSTADPEKAAMLALGVGGSPSGQRNSKPPISRSFSLTKLFSSRIRSPSSLPVTPVARSNPASTHGGHNIDPVSYSASYSEFLIITHHFISYMYIKTYLLFNNGKRRNEITTLWMFHS